MERREQKKIDFFRKLEAAESRQADKVAQFAFYLARKVLDEKKKQLRAALAGKNSDGKNIHRLKTEVAQLREQVKWLAPEALHGLNGSPAERRWRKRENGKASWLEWIHTGLGRAMGASAGIGSAEVETTGLKALIRHSLGAGPQAVAAGISRIISEVPQIRINKAGRPKLPSSLTATANFKRNNRAFRAARGSVKASGNAIADLLGHLPATASGKTLAELLAAPTENEEEIAALLPQVSDDEVDRLARELEAFLHSIDDGMKYERNDKNLWIRLEQDYRSKRTSAVISLLSGLVSYGALAIDPSGAGVKVGRSVLCLVSLLLQPFSLKADYDDGTFEFPEKITAERIDLRQLLKPGRENKPLEELRPEDFNTAIATQLYDEQPQLVYKLVLAIAQHVIGEQIARRNALEKEIKKIDDRDYRRSPMEFMRFRNTRDGLMRMRKQKQDELEKIRVELETLRRERDAFKAHDHAGIDNDGLVGKAIIDPLFFCWKGVRANLFNQPGEKAAQINQRFNTFLNVAGSIGEVAPGIDVANAMTHDQSGQHVNDDQGAANAMAGKNFVQDAIHSMTGDGPENKAAEHAMIATAALAVGGSINSWLTTGPARFNKGVYDRAKLGAPAYISRSERIEADSREGLVKKAYEVGAISARKKKRLEKALAVLGNSTGAEAEQLQDRRGRFKALRTKLDNEAVKRMRKRWDGFEKLRARANQIANETATEWHFEKEGLDMRRDGTCFHHYVPARTRAGQLAKGTFKSMFSSIRFWNDIAVSRRARRKWSEIVKDGKIADPQRVELIERAALTLQSLTEFKRTEKDVHDFLLSLAQEHAQRIRHFSRLPIWDLAPAGERLETQIEEICSGLTPMTAEVFAALDDASKTAAREDLHMLGKRMRKLREVISSITSAQRQAGMASRELRRYLGLMESGCKLDEGMLRVEELRGVLGSELLQHAEFGI